MQHSTPSCQLSRARVGVSSSNSLLSGDIRCRETALRVAPEHQWLATTTGRIATDPYSWMQAVHWVGGSGLYIPTQKHGPKWGPTTVLIAQEISALGECRPSVGYLARKLGLSERTVKYHLAILRESGLLVYRSKGTRIQGQVRQASVYERVVPVEFDHALGIRTKVRDDDAPAYTRVPVGIAEAGRKAVGKLAKKAARKMSRTRTSRTRSRDERCTPMQVGTSALSTTGTSSLPSESKLASGESQSPTPKKSTRGPKKVNRVGRRYQVAGELISSVPWLGRASRARVAWIVRHVADAGWTAVEIRAVAEAVPLVAAEVRRPSGMLAHRLKGAHELFTTVERRRTAVLAWQESRAAERARHHGFDDVQQQPTRRSVQRLVNDACVQVAVGTASQVVEYAAGDAGDLEGLDPTTVLQMRAAAEADHALIHAALQVMGERDTRRLYTNRLVDLALKTAAQQLTHAAF
ncbi:helix-turn-helix domain-containing protein [Streptomyces sp. DH12]|uniref:helix-turn-helix domain-containing protein n=1 Tax=Streptomyces sp. DH12 TaxID=2857010 RepID=UPI001E2B30C9|nr:helix-turn-helix domain-containing protein [Streptomyces sp. DH12]